MDFSKKYKYIMPCILGLTMVYGVVNFRGAPIRPCDEQKYCGKSGNSVTREEYEAYRTWETTLILVGLGAFFSMLVERGLMRDSARPD